jgi:hypothetical protein
VPVAHVCNPSYSGGRDQEDRGSRPAQANSLQDPISKIPNKTRAGRVAQVRKRLPSMHEALSSNLIPPKRKKKKKDERPGDLASKMTQEVCLPWICGLHSEPATLHLFLLFLSDQNVTKYGFLTYESVSLSPVVGEWGSGGGPPKRRKKGGVLNSALYILASKWEVKISGTNPELVAHTYNPSYSGGRDQEDHGWKLVHIRVWETLSRKYPTQKRAGEVAQVLKHLPSKHEALSE